MEFEVFDCVGTQFFWEVVSNDSEECKEYKTALSTPSDFEVIVLHRLRKELYVATDDGDFQPAYEQVIWTGSKSISVDSSLFAFKDDSVRRKVSQALSVAGVNKDLWKDIAEKVMSEGIEMVKGNMKVFKGRDSRVLDTVVVDVVTAKRFVCHEEVGEN